MDSSYQQFPSVSLSSPFPIEFETFSPINTAIGIDTEMIGVLQPLDCLQGSPIPPFLMKTFDLVDDRSLDPIISWGPTGESFVVWDPVEFSRLILPRNFKHNNFSSFVRQLNTYVGTAVTQPLMAAVIYKRFYIHRLIFMLEVSCFISPRNEHSSPLFVNWSGELHLLKGFRKIDADRWEFANEAFQRGKRHLLKTIQRRKLPQSQQVGSYIGPSTETGKSGLEEIENLRKERSMLMQEVVELQQQHRGTASYMEVVNQRLQAAEQRQKQMVSFLAKVLQNSAFLGRLHPRKEQGEIGSSRMRRKFVKHQQLELGKSDSSMEGQIVKYRPDWRNLTMVSGVPELNPEGMVGMDLGPEGMPFETENVTLDDLAVSDELTVAHGVIKTPEQVGEGTSSLGSEDPYFKGKNVISTQQAVTPEYLVSFPVDLMKEKNFPEFSSPGIESIAKQEEIWSMDFDTSAGISSSSNELWGNLVNYDVPELGVTGGLSDIWDMGSVQAAGGSGIDKWPAYESPFDEPESHAG